MFSEANNNVQNAFLMKERVRSKPRVILYCFHLQKNMRFQN